MKWILGLGLAASFLLAPGIWLERPFFTPIPIAGALNPVPPPFDLAVFVALLALLGAILLATRPRRLIFAWALLFTLRTFWDQATWQPFFLMFAFLLFATALVTWDEHEPDRDLSSAVLNTGRFTVVAIYIWSGLSKLSYGFVQSVLPVLLGAVGISLPTELIAPVGLLFPLGEIAIGLGLLWPRTRPLALGAAILMHAFILLALGPFGLNYNRVVWPWNMAMVAILLVLFRGASDVRAHAILLNRGFPLHVAAVALFGVLPGLSYLGLWPTYLSFRLYSEQYHQATISMTQTVQLKLPPRTRQEVILASADDYDAHLDLMHWSEHELGAFIPPEPRVFRAVARRVCALADAPLDVRLIIAAPADRWTGEMRLITIYCDGI